MQPFFEWLENGSSELTGTQITDVHPIEFGSARRGNTVYPTTVVQRTLDLWNDRNAVNGSDTATGIKLSAVALDGDPDHPLFAGTTMNGGLSCLQVRSVGGIRCVADSQSDWTRIGPDDVLEIGDMPSNSMRTIEVRIELPVDMEPMALSEFSLDVSHD